MNKKSAGLLLTFFSLLLILPGVSLAEEQTLAELHVEQDGCEACHVDEKPSADGSYEFAQCQECHGSFAEMDEVHKPHDGELMCTDCHQPHEMTATEKPVCDSCHDDGRTAESTLKK